MPVIKGLTYCFHFVDKKFLTCLKHSVLSKNHNLQKKFPTPPPRLPLLTSRKISNLVLIPTPPIIRDPRVIGQHLSPVHNVYMFPTHTCATSHQSTTLEAKKCRAAGKKDGFIQNT